MQRKVHSIPATPTIQHQSHVLTFLGMYGMHAQGWQCLAPMLPAARLGMTGMPQFDKRSMQATVNLATETALVRAAMADEPDGHAERLEVLGKELVLVSELLQQQCRVNASSLVHQMVDQQDYSCSLSQAVWLMQPRRMQCSWQMPVIYP